MLSCSVLLLSLALVLVSGMTVPPPASTKAHHHANMTHGTHPPKPSHEPGVAGHSFHYVRDIHNLILRTKSSCYVMVLSGMDVNDVHSPTGLRQLEVQLLNAVDNPATHTKLDPGSVEKPLLHVCHLRNNVPMDIFRVN